MSIVGSFRGTPGYMAYHADKKGADAVRKLTLLADYPHSQGRYSMLRLCGALTTNHHARLQGDNIAFADGVFNPHGQGVQAIVSKTLEQTALDPLDTKLVRLPVRHSGGGIRNAGANANIAWLASHSATAKWITNSYPITHVLSRALTALQAQPDPAVESTEYANRLHRAVQEYRQLFEQAGERRHDPDQDGFEMSPVGLMDKSVKFQHAAQLLQTKVELREIRPYLSLAQAVGFKAQSARGAGALITALPVKGSPFYLPNSIFTYVFQRRFLKQSIGALDSNVEDACSCSIGGCREKLSYSHLESCVCTPIMEQRHEVLRTQTQHMFDEVGVNYDKADLRCHMGIRNRLAAAGVVNSAGAIIQYSGPGRKRGNHEGADMLVHSLELPGDETAMDFTVVNDRAECRINPTATPYTGTDAQLAATLKGAEAAKEKHYGDLYGKINIKIRGIAMDLAGDIGPNLRALIKRCEVIGGYELPEWANWSAGTSFYSAWRQRIIVSVLAKNAECALRNRGRSKVARAAAVASGVGG